MTGNILNTSPSKLVSYIRDGLIEQEHFGYIVRCDKYRVIEKIGEDNNYPFFMRSCEKPFQASLLVDYEIDKKYSLTEEEIAVCCASHAGESIHTETIKNLLKKFNLQEEDLQCPAHEPLSKTAIKQLIINNETPTKIHNNCSGKHTLMLGICVSNNWDTKNYMDINHPLQQAILKKVYELCKIKTPTIITKDGCGVPVVSMPLKNMVFGYLNLFCDTKYEKIKKAFLNNPYLIGGESRTDTKIIENTNNIIAKVGAGGLCIVVNTQIEEAFAIKICDSNMEAREIATIDLINNLHWGNIKISHEIKTLHNEATGKIITSF